MKVLSTCLAQRWTKLRAKLRALRHHVTLENTRKFLRHPELEGCAALLAIVTSIVTAVTIAIVTLFSAWNIVTNMGTSVTGSDTRGGIPTIVAHSSPSPILSPASPTPQLIQTADSRSDLRAKNGVRPIDFDKFKGDRGIPLSDLPDYTYGFALPWQLGQFGQGATGLSLYRELGNTAVMEVHKSGGKIFIIGYVSAKKRQQLQDSTRTEEIYVDVYYRRRSDADQSSDEQLVAIPTERILSVEYNMAFESYHEIVIAAPTHEADTP